MTFPHSRPPGDLPGQRHFPFVRIDPAGEECRSQDQDPFPPWTSADAVAWILGLSRQDQLANLARLQAGLDQLNEVLRRQWAVFEGGYRRFAQEEVVGDRDAMADRLDRCRQALQEQIGQGGSRLPQDGPDDLDGKGLKGPRRA
jgi:hypothetical protein